MADGFGAVTCGWLIDPPGGTSTAEVTEIHIPGGAVNYVDIGGALPTRFNLRAYLTDVTYASLLALVGTQATLTIASVAYNNALLVSLDRSMRRGANLTFAEASFIVP